MSEVKIEQAFFVEGVRFATYAEAQAQVLRIKLYNRITQIANQDLLGLEQIVDILIEHRDEFANLLVPQTGWKDNKMEQDKKAAMDWFEKNRPKPLLPNQFDPIYQPKVVPMVDTPGIGVSPLPIICNGLQDRTDWADSGKIRFPQQDWAAS